MNLDFLLLSSYPSETYNVLEHISHGTISSFQTTYLEFTIWWCDQIERHREDVHEAKAQQPHMSSLTPGTGKKRRQFLPKRQTAMHISVQISTWPWFTAEGYTDIETEFGPKDDPSYRDQRHCLYPPPLLVLLGGPWWASKACGVNMLYSVLHKQYGCICMCKCSMYIAVCRKTRKPKNKENNMRHVLEFSWERGSVFVSVFVRCTP